MSEFEREINEYYLKTQEWQRLSSDQGQLEKLRTEAILSRELPSAPAVIFDIGGGAGIHALPLARKGYEVHLIDPVERHLQQARDQVTSSGVALASISLGDARNLELPANLADAVLLLGPLYHLTDHSQRIKALREAHRILKPGGVIFAAGISRFASLIDGLSSGFFHDAAFREIVADDLHSGQHRNPTDNPFYFTTAYFHRPEELAAELKEAGFVETRVLAVEGPAWSAAHFREVWKDQAQKAKLMEFLSKIETEPALLGASAHLIAVAKSTDQQLQNQSKSFHEKAG